MELGIAGRLMMAVEPERLATSPSSTKNEHEPELDPIQMLELEVEALTLDLDEERARGDEQRSVCEKHLRELQNAQTDLFDCRQALGESEQKLALALVEIEEKSEVLKQTEEQMLRSKDQAREAERQMDQAKTQMLVQDRSADSTVKELSTALDDRIVEVAQCQERYELLENEFSDYKATVLHQINTLEEDYRQQKGELEAKIKKLKAKSASFEAEIGSNSASSSGSKEVNDLRRYLRTVSKQKEEKDNDISKLKQLLEARESKIIKLSDEMGELQAKIRRVSILTSQVTKLESQNTASKIRFDEEQKKMEKRAADLKSQNTNLKTDLEKARQDRLKLESRVADLEKVRAESRGVVFCVDLSGSLLGAPVDLAKEAFRKCIESLRSKAPKAHVGVVVHASTVSIVRTISTLDSATDNVLNLISCGGAENYYSAIALVKSELSSFRSRFPRAKRVVIMISDGQDSGTPGDVSSFASQRIPCHNIVVEASSSYPSYETEKYSAATGGMNIRYDGTPNLGQFDALIA
ncbi:hypothetical protein V8E51_011098 [Hyaloscypha variabilis]